MQKSAAEKIAAWSKCGLLSNIQIFLARQKTVVSDGRTRREAYYADTAQGMQCKANIGEEAQLA